MEVYACRNVVSRCILGTQRRHRIPSIEFSVDMLFLEVVFITSVTPVEIQRSIFYKGPELHRNSIAPCIFIFHSSILPFNIKQIPCILLIVNQHMHFVSLSPLRQTNTDVSVPRNMAQGRMMKSAMLCSVCYFTFYLIACLLRKCKQTDKQTNKHNISRIYSRIRCDDLCPMCAIERSSVFA
jgi:hypothetical protein